MSNDAMRDALEAIKNHVSDSINSWRTSDDVAIMRGTIEDICEAALAAPAQTEPVGHFAVDEIGNYYQVDDVKKHDLGVVPLFDAAPAQSDAKPVYQYRMRRGAWEEDTWHDTYYEDYMRAQGESHIESRILYTAPTAPSATTDEMFASYMRARTTDFETWMNHTPPAPAGDGADAEDQLDWQGPYAYAVGRSLYERTLGGPGNRCGYFGDLKMEDQAYWIAKAARHAPTGADAAQPERWLSINDAPWTDDLIWVRKGDSIDGPKRIDNDDYDKYTHYAPCEPPSLRLSTLAKRGGA
ncbi:hypothetical protein [Robbsia andropogonis]|uniref:hypothetical protein n=1 Tax=Robbsia andropogonis TaxID=28092 RepID=UPI00209F0D3A|nr:hypothetical protein [Robbsia andropogonis]MCP1118889.1 hypothetical protein [Robbsia andropogonis]MCP1128356.1 hypothetical protein [Robbsia andropogonis]